MNVDASNVNLIRYDGGVFRQTSTFGWSLIYFGDKTNEEPDGPEITRKLEDLGRSQTTLTLHESDGVEETRQTWVINLDEMTIGVTQPNAAYRHIGVIRHKSYQLADFIGYIRLKTDWNPVDNGKMEILQSHDGSWNIINSTNPNRGIETYRRIDRSLDGHDTFLTLAGRKGWRIKYNAETGELERYFVDGNGRMPIHSYFDVELMLPINGRVVNYISFEDTAQSTKYILQFTKIGWIGTIQDPNDTTLTESDFFRALPFTRWSLEEHGWNRITLVNDSSGDSISVDALNRRVFIGTRGDSRKQQLSDPSLVMRRHWDVRNPQLWQEEFEHIPINPRVLRPVHKSPGFLIRNNTQFPLQITLEQVGPLYAGVVQPGEWFYRRTGAVWFTVKAGIFLDNTHKINKWDIGLPIAAFSTVAIGMSVAALVAGAGAVVAGVAEYETAIAADTVGTVFEGRMMERFRYQAFRYGASLLEGLPVGNINRLRAIKVGLVLETIASASLRGYALSATVERALQELVGGDGNVLTEHGMYAGKTWPFHNRHLHTYQISGGLEASLTGDGHDTLELSTSAYHLEHIDVLNS